MADTRVDELRRRLERDPGSRLFAQLAEELRKSGELTEAIRVARSGLAVHPAYPSARLTLGRALLESGDPAAARSELESALRDAPDNILASRSLAQACESLGDLSGAAEQYRRTLLMAPGDRQLQTALQAVEARLAAPAAVKSPDTTARSTETPPRAERATEVVGMEGEGARALPATLRLRASEPALHPPPLPPRPSVASAPPPLPPTPAPAPPTPPPVPPLPPAAVRPAVSVHERPQDVGPVPTPRQPAPPVPTAAPEVTAELRAEWAASGGEGSTLPPGTHVPLAGAGPVSEVGAPGPHLEPTAGGPAAPFSSSTLAELYLQQGLVEKAVEVYRQVVQREPGNDKARRRLAELESGGGHDQQTARRRAIERMIAGLEQLLGAVRRR